MLTISAIPYSRWVAAIITVTVTACGGSTSGTSPTQNTPVTETVTHTDQDTLSVGAFVSKGPVTGASCELVSLDNTGQDLAVLASATSVQGRIEFGEITYSGAAAVRCSGGSFIDEATGHTVTAPAMTNRVFLAESGDIIVTPFTELATQTSLSLAEIAQLFGMINVDLAKTLPLDVTEASLDDTDSGAYGLALALFSKLIDLNDSDPESTLQRLVADLDDGHLSNTHLSLLNRAVDELLADPSQMPNANPRAIMLMAQHGGYLSPLHSNNAYLAHAFFGGVTMAGDIRYRQQQDQFIHIAGDLTLAGGVGEFDAVSLLNVTGNASVSSGAQVQYLLAGGDATVAHAAHVQRIDAVGNITLSTGAQTAHANAGGDITALNSLNGQLIASGNIVIDNGGADIQDVRAGGDVTVLQAERISTITANNVTLQARWPMIQRIAANQNFQCGALPLWGENGEFGLITATHFIDIGTEPSQYCAGVNIDADGDNVTDTRTAEQLNSVNTGVATPLNLQQLDINDQRLTDAATLTFQHVAGAIIVTARSLGWVPDGVYQLAKHGEDWHTKLYLCQTVIAGRCSSEAYDISRAGPSNTWISYSEETQTWTLDGATTGANLIPSMVLFEGNVLIKGRSDAPFFNTFMATGHIRTASETHIIAPMFAGTDFACEGNTALSFTTTDGETLHYDLSTAYPAHALPALPTLCNNHAAAKESGLWGIASQALIAGVHTGGNIDAGIELSSKTYVLGGIVSDAGLNTSGTSRIYGHALVGLEKPSVSNLRGQTLIDSQTLPDSVALFTTFVQP